MTHSHACGACSTILRMLESASTKPWSAEERAELLRRSEASLRETTASIAVQRELLKLKMDTKMKKRYWGESG